MMEKSREKKQVQVENSCSYPERVECKVPAKQQRTASWM